MTWLWIVLFGWLSIAFLAALLIGGGVRMADRRDGAGRGGRRRSPLSRPSAEGLFVVPSGGRRVG